MEEGVYSAEYRKRKMYKKVALKNHNASEETYRSLEPTNIDEDMHIGFNTIALLETRTDRMSVMNNSKYNV